MVMNISEYVSGSFDGMLVVGDIHGDHRLFRQAYNYAKSENYFFTSLGDLTDRGPYPYEVVRDMSNAVFDGRAGLIVGNHDDKIYRYASGAKVNLSRDAKGTFESVGPLREKEFLELYTRMMNDAMLCGLYFKFGDITLVHGASHPCLWESDGKFGKTAKSRALYGETTGEVYPDGYPVRAYEWINEVPIGKTVIVGHDKQPVHNVPITEPMIVKNPNGGQVIFMDTGCGKGGFLSGVVVLHGKKGFYIDEYKEFK